MNDRQQRESNYGRQHEYSCAGLELKSRHHELHCATKKIMLRGKLKHAIKSALHPDWKREFEQKQALPDLLGVLREAGLRFHFHLPAPSAQPLFERATYHGIDMQSNIFAWRD